jgi:large subunit ribosomal protein L25
MKIAVSVHFSNDAISPGIKRGGMLNVVRHTVECYVDPDNVPDQFDADLSALEINDNLRWSNLTGTDGIRPVIQDRDFVIATVAAPTKMPEVVVDGGTPAGGTKAPAKPAAKKK